jgi:hypothetical protein
VLDPGFKTGSVRDFGMLRRPLVQNPGYGKFGSHHWIAGADVRPGIDALKFFSESA